MLHWPVLVFTPMVSIAAIVSSCVILQGYTGLIVAGGHGGFQAVLRAPADFV